MFRLFICFLLVGAVYNKGLKVTKKPVQSKSGHGKIIGGNNVTIEEFPYQAYLKISSLGDAENKYRQCGGSIISDSFILSAAHCFLNATEIQARIGSVQPARGGRIYRSTYFKIHSKYNPVTKDYDIAVMKTERKMNLDGAKRKTVILVERKMPISSGSKVIVSGWGRVAPEGPLSPTLKAVELQTISNMECNEKLGGISDRQLCAGVKDGSEDFCKGDSGGPLVLSDTKIQVGIVSASYGCAKPDSPGILANVTDLRDWIHFYTGV